MTRPAAIPPTRPPTYQPRRKIYAEEVAEAMERQWLGESLKEVAEGMGVSPESLSYSIRRAKLHGFLAVPTRELAKMWGSRVGLGR